MKRVPVRICIVKTICIMIVLSLLVPVYSLSSSYIMNNTSTNDEHCQNENKEQESNRYCQPVQCQSISACDQSSLAPVSYVDPYRLQAKTVLTELQVKLEYSDTLLLLYRTESLLRPPI